MILGGSLQCAIGGASLFGGSKCSTSVASTVPYPGQPAAGPVPVHECRKSLVVHSQAPQRLHEGSTSGPAPRSASWWAPFANAATASAHAMPTAAPEAALLTAANSLNRNQMPDEGQPDQPIAQTFQELLSFSSPTPVMPSLPAATVQFTVPEFVTAMGQALVLVGSVPQLGSWDVQQGLKMTWHSGHRWTAEIELTPGWHGALEFKIALEEKKAYTWEAGNNRLLVVERPKFSHSKSKSSGEKRSGTQYGPKGPILPVECEWGKAEAPAPMLPPSLLCSPDQRGVLANGMPLNSNATPLQSNNANSTDSNARVGNIVMANCQVVVPLLEAHNMLSEHNRDSRHDGNDGSDSRHVPSDLQVVVVGSVPALGCWDPAQGLRLAADESGMWRASLELPMGYPVQAKLLLWDCKANKVRHWEKGGNRTIRLPDPPASMQQITMDMGTSSMTPVLNCNTNFGSGRSTAEAAGTNSSANSYGWQQQASSSPAGLTSRSNLYPMMPDGEFMLIMHWDVPSFPHLAFLPSLSSDQSQTASNISVQLLKQSLAHSRPATVQCKFTVPYFPTLPGQHLLLVGAGHRLGNWDPTCALKLQWGPGHTWQAATHLPADCETEAKLVLWDGHAYIWESGPNRKLHPGDMVSRIAAPGIWGEVLHCLYWQGRHATGKTPALVIPHDELLASSSRLAAGNAVAGRKPHVQQGVSSSHDHYDTHTMSLGSPQQGPTGYTAGVGTAAKEPGLALLNLLSVITAVAVKTGASERTGPRSPGKDNGFVYPDPQTNSSLHDFYDGGGSKAAAVATAHQVAGLEAALDSMRSQLSESNTQKAKEVEGLRKQLTDASRALAVEEDQVEELHAQLASRGAELRNLQQQLARAEATASAAVAAATTALSSASVYAPVNGVSHGTTGNEVMAFGIIGKASNNGNGTAATASSYPILSHQITSSNNGTSTNNGVPSVAVATFQKLMEQLADQQLATDTLRRELSETAAAKNSEIARLRAELSEAMAARHKDGEAARMAAATADLAHQQEMARLQGALSDLQSKAQRELSALQSRMDALASSSATETSRLARQLAQACAAAEALEAQVLAQRTATASLSASGSAELQRLRDVISSQASELEALRGQVADRHAAAALKRLSNGGLNTLSGSSYAGVEHPTDNNTKLTAPQAGTNTATNNTSLQQAGYAVVPVADLSKELQDAIADVRAAKQALQELPYSLPGTGIPASNGNSPQVTAFEHVAEIAASVGTDDGHSLTSAAVSNGLKPSRGDNSVSHKFEHRYNGNGGNGNGATSYNNIVPMQGFGDDDAREGGSSWNGNGFADSSDHSNN